MITKCTSAVRGTHLALHNVNALLLPRRSMVDAGYALTSAHAAHMSNTANNSRGSRYAFVGLQTNCCHRSPICMYFFNTSLLDNTANRQGKTGKGRQMVNGSLQPVPVDCTCQPDAVCVTKPISQAITQQRAQEPEPRGYSRTLHEGTSCAAPRR